MVTKVRINGKYYNQTAKATAKELGVNYSILMYRVKNKDIKYKGWEIVNLKAPIREGDIFPTKKCGDVEVIGCICTNKEFLIKFLSNGFMRFVTSDNLKRGRVYNFTAKNICGVACIGYGPYKSVDIKEENGVGKKIIAPAYLQWITMIRDCYAESPRYPELTVCSNWLNYQIFAEWYKDFDHKPDCRYISRYDIYPATVLSPDSLTREGITARGRKKRIKI